MITIRDRKLPNNWRVALVEDNRRSRYIEIFDPKDQFVQNLTPSHKLYSLFDALLGQSPAIDDKDLLELYEKSADGVSHKYGRVLAYGRAVIELTRKSWGLS